MKNPFAKKPKPNYKKTSKERGAVPMSRTRGKGVPNVIERQRQENREALIEKVQPVLHPVATAKKKASARAARLRQVARNAAVYKAFGVCPKCTMPNKPRHRCNLSIDLTDKGAAQEEYLRLKKIYGGGR